MTVREKEIKEDDRIRENDWRMKERKERKWGRKIWRESGKGKERGEKERDKGCLKDRDRRGQRRRKRTMERMRKKES